MRSMRSMKGTIRLMAFAFLLTLSVVAVAESAQGPAKGTAEHLMTSAAELKEFIASTNSKIDGLLAASRDKVEAATMARENIEATISDLDALIARFDAKGDVRLDLEAAKAFSQAKAIEYGSSKNEKLRAIAPRFEGQVAQFTTLEAEAARLVKSAYEQKRRLEDSKEAIIALEEEKMMDDVLLIFQDSLKELSGVIDATSGFLDNVEKTTGGVL